MKKLDPVKIKKRIMKIGLKTGAGHVASAMSCVDVLCDTYNSRPDAIVILSKGHGALAQYVILNEMGLLPDKILKTYHQDGGLSEHSTLMMKYGVYASTGSLGHGLGIGIGYAIANLDRPVFVVMSDGELDEGSTLESLRIISKLRLVNILPVVDRNDLTAFSKFDDVGLYNSGQFSVLQLQFKEYYSVKGEGWGNFEGGVASHYAKVDQELYDIWNKNFPKIMKEREKTRKERLKLLKEKENERNK